MNNSYPIAEFGSDPLNPQSRHSGLENLEFLKSLPGEHLPLLIVSRCSLFSYISNLSFHVCVASTVCQVFCHNVPIAPGVESKTLPCYFMSFFKMSPIDAGILFCENA